MFHLPFRRGWDGYLLQAGRREVFALLRGLLRDNPALQSAYDACSQGKYEPLFAYLRSLENAEPLYEAKLVLVGEGNVGKTTLLKALKGKAGEAPQEHEPTTHGVEIDIHGLRLPHPAAPPPSMRWPHDTAKPAAGPRPRR